MLAKGDIVSSTYFPEAVEIKKCESIAEDFYVVEAIGQESSKFYEVMVESKKINEFQQINNKKESGIQAEDVQKYIQYLLLKNEAKFSHTKALGNQNVIPLPHQIEAVYGRMLQVPQPRFLLADDPGAGKTIMAGMLMKELQARLMANRILILVPPLVLKQWQEELDQKFGLHFHIINRNVVKEYGGKNPFTANSFCLASMYWAIRDDVKALIQESDFDLVIIDEAHKMAAYTQGTAKKKVFRTKLYQLGESILRKAEHCLLLTATPHKGDTENFRHLMKLIDEDVFSSTTINESIQEKANPFIIRRLKENLSNFDGTPIFPKRTSKTIQFQLTDEELELYDAVTEYVRHYFNRAINNGSQSTAFAMMLLQRRLSSSIEAIYLSLRRRYKRLVKLYKQTEKERKRYVNKVKKLDTENYLEEGNEQQEKLVAQLVQSTDVVDMKELKKEILAIKGLIKQIEHIKFYTVEKKFEELEETLFGEEGLLLQQNEKIIIFTESVDTLNYLEEQLLKRVPKVAKIIGGFPMNKRHQQVEMFRNGCQIMLATDAGGESINLQFCNQMINYDIPWNPNRLEQRMGRIHRIGQKNEVFIFNLVAKNTREGSVMVRLLEKMEKMRTDLGSDLVYDFIGEVLEDQYDSLANLMQEAIVNREKLEEVIANVDKTLSDENERLLNLVEEERLTEEKIDLPQLKRQTNEWFVERIPKRFYADFTSFMLEKKRVRIQKSKDETIMRIERLPKFIRDNMPDSHDEQIQNYRFTNSVKAESEDVPLITDIHPLFHVGLQLMKKEVEGRAWQHYIISANVPEKLHVEIYEITITDGTGKELERRLVHLAKREYGDILILNPNWVFLYEFAQEDLKVENNTANQCGSEIMKQSISVRHAVLSNREKQLNKMHTFLEKSFNQQYRDTLDKLETYQQENTDNKNSALINQMNAKLIDLDQKKEERLNLINRQKNVSMKPPKKVISLEVDPIGYSQRVLASDYYETIVRYEKANGRLNVKQYDNLGLIDFSSERFNGEERYILLTSDSDFMLSERELEDLHDVLDMLFVYVVKNGLVEEEIKI
ncbi:DEAD/DEAH box helicase [Virgibacillus ihumii]|uniref:DEAD/DEAH box helicase n=1 Tax=Virgibacillus ihumii TaxID=2686091 RepID=UPI00157D66E3|nr:helicase-related protein [Virgibacillus ihumii]